MEKVRHTRDYLHLYLGCMYQWQDEDGEWRKALPLTSYQLNDVLRYHINARLILRPLSDITDEELASIGHFPHVPLHRDDLKFKISLNKWTPDHFIFLLSKGFDLFGLIEEGLAIDKTIKEPVFPHEHNGQEPAFPGRKMDFIGNTEMEVSTYGLTKREYFAAVCLGHAVDKWYNHSDSELVSRSIRLADELLKQLEQ